LFTVFLCDDLASFTVHFQKLRNVESWLLENLDLLDMDFVKWVGRSGSLGDVGCHGVWKKLGDNTSDVSVGNFTLHDVHHLLTDGSDLGGLSVGGLLDLVLSSLGETNAKESELVSVSGCTINVSFDLGLPLLDDGALFVTGQFHTVEVGQTVVTLDFFADQSEFSVGGFVTVKIGLVDLVDTSSETISSQLGTG